MMATVIPRDSTKNRNLSGKGEPAMTATVNPRKTCELERWSLPW